MRKCWSEILVTALLFWLPIDLLYLYYGGWWYDPIKAVEIIEVVLLYCIPVFGIWRFIKIMRNSEVVK